MLYFTNKEIKQNELEVLFVAHGSKYGWPHSEIQRLLILYEGFTKKSYIYLCQPVLKSNLAAQVLPQYSEKRWRTFTLMKPTNF